MQNGIKKAINLRASVRSAALLKANRKEKEREREVLMDKNWQIGVMIIRKQNRNRQKNATQDGNDVRG